jgi:hypothetical protein
MANEIPWSAGWVVANLDLGIVLTIQLPNPQSLVCVAVDNLTCFRLSALASCGVGSSPSTLSYISKSNTHPRFGFGYANRLM